MSGGLRVACAYVALCLLWSMSWLAVKVGLDGVPPFTGAALRLLVGGVLLGAYQLARGRSLHVDAGSRAYVASMSVMLFAVPQSLIYLGQTQITSGLAAVLYGALPLYAVLIAARLLPDEPSTLPKLVGVALGIGGLVIVFGGSLQLDASGLSILAMLGLILAPASQALAQVLLKQDASRVTALVLLTWATLGAGTLLLVLGLVAEPRHVSLDARTLGSIAFLGVGSTFLGYCLLFWLLPRVGALPLALVYQILPLLALLWGRAFYGERLTLTLALGSLVVVAGIGLASGVTHLRGGPARQGTAPLDGVVAETVTAKRRMSE